MLPLFAFPPPVLLNGHDTFPVQDLPRSGGLASKDWFIHIWHMPLLFLLAETPAWYAFASHTATQASASG